jgi:hypothetical protein
MQARPRGSSSLAGTSAWADGPSRPIQEWSSEMGARSLTADFSVVPVWPACRTRLTPTLHSHKSGAKTAETPAVTPKFRFTSAACAVLGCTGVDRPRGGFRTERTAPDAPRRNAGHWQPQVYWPVPTVTRLLLTTGFKFLKGRSSCLICKIMEGLTINLVQDLL